MGAAHSEPIVKQASGAMQDIGLVLCRSDRLSMKSPIA
jgi:hypothetical protein